MWEARRLRLAALAAVLAVAVAVPFGVHLFNGSVPEASSPGAQRHAAERPLSAPEAARKARSTGKDVEATAERTANSTTWVRPDGLLRTRVYSDTIRAKEHGKWKKIDTTLHRVEDGYAPKTVNDPLIFSAGTKGQRAARATFRAALTATPTETSTSWTELVRLNTGGQEVVVSWPGPLPEPAVNGPRALYENVRPGIDLLLTARDSGYSHVLIVHNREAANDPLLDDVEYLLSSPSAGLSFHLDTSTRTVSAVDTAGETMATSPTPYMWDSAGEVKATIGEEASSPTPGVPSDGTFVLPGLAGPQPGSHDGILAAALSENNALTLTVNKRFLADADTVYPVFIDPSFVGRKKNWTLLYEKYAGSSFYNGQNFNDGTNEARVGWEADTAGKSRAVFTFEFDPKLHGANIRSASFRALQTYSWGCSARQFDLYQTTGISSSSTWNNQPTWTRVLSTKTNGYGYKAVTCPDSWVAMDIKVAAQEAASKSWSALTLGLRAANEGDTNAWKKFMANGENSPSIEIIYNHPPNEPTGSLMKTSPGGVCDAVEPYYPAIGKSTITFSSSASDPDGNLEYLHLKVWRSDIPTLPVVHDADHTTNSDGAMTPYPIPYTSFVDGATYSWSVYSKDKDGATSTWGPPRTSNYCKFKIDQTAPNSPEVTSPDWFPPPGDDGNGWSKNPFGSSGRFTFSPNGSATGLKEYQYSFNTAFDRTALPNSAPSGVTKPTDGSAIVGLAPPHAGPSVLYVRSVDTAGNISPAVKYQFYVRPKPEPDAPMDVTGDNVPDVFTIDGNGNLQVWAKTMGTDRLHFPMSAAYTMASGKAEDLPDGTWTGALISHNGDWLPGDGVQDLIARMSDGRLYAYPGDGYGAFNVDDRREIRMPLVPPTGMPQPSAFRQILSTGDVTGDGRPDLLVLAGGDLWAFTGYSGGAFTTAAKLSGDDWTSRDLVQVVDVAGDAAQDLVFRSDATGRLFLRKGKLNTNGTGTNFGSFATQAASNGGADFAYGTSGWSRSVMRIVIGTPDVSDDGVPDIWGLDSAGTTAVYRGSRTVTIDPTTRFNVTSSSVGNSWATHSAIG